MEFNCCKHILEDSQKGKVPNLVGKTTVTLWDFVKDGIGELDARGDLVLSRDLAEDRGSLLAGCTKYTSHLKQKTDEEFIKIEMYCLENTEESNRQKSKI